MSDRQPRLWPAALGSLALVAAIGTGLAMVWPEERNDEPPLPQARHTPRSGPPTLASTVTTVRFGRTTEILTDDARIHTEELCRRDGGKPYTQPDYVMCDARRLHGWRHGGWMYGVSSVPSEFRDRSPAR